MLEKEFVPFEEALELKELEFDEPCVAFYEQSKRFFMSRQKATGHFLNIKLIRKSL